MGKVILETERLTKRFGGLVATDNVSLQFESDSLHAIIGPNGAGKTTLFNLLAGTLHPTEGDVLFRGENITELDPEKIARRGLIRSYQNTELFESLTVLENIRLAAQVGSSNPFNFWSDIDSLKEPKTRAKEIAQRLDLEEKQDEVVSSLSHGERRVLEIGITLGSDPDLLLLDEPTAGMSAEETQQMMTLIEELSVDTPIVFIEHKMSVVMGVADRIVVLNDGQKIADGNPTEIQDDERVREVYLGEA
jgi:branched-chain amino acid transport system ATP-binding protein